MSGRFPRPEMYKDWQEWARAVVLASDEPEIAGPEYALADHDHDTDYAPLVHNHDAAYAPLGHNHDLLYAPIGHTHPDPNLISLVTAMSETDKESLRSLLKVRRVIARMHRTTTGAGVDQRTPGVNVAFEATALDTYSCVTLGPPSKFTIPVGLNGKKVRVVGQVESLNNNNGVAEVQVRVNGSVQTPAVEVEHYANQTTTTVVVGITSYEFSVATGDEIVLWLTVSNDATTAFGPGCWMELELCN